MVSACAYSGAYPTGYGRYGKNTEGVPDEMFDPRRRRGSRTSSSRAPARSASTTTTCGSRRWSQPLDDLGESWALHDETAEPGYYAATLDTGMRCEITVGEKVAVHRYTFPEHPQRPGRASTSRCGGLAIDHGRTVPLRAHVESMGHGRAQGTVVWRACRCRSTSRCDSPGWRQMLWHDRRLIEGGTRLDFDSIRQTTLRPFGLLFMGPAARRPARRGAHGLLPARLRAGAREPVARVRRRPSRSSTTSGPGPRPAGPTTSTGSGSRAARPRGARSSPTALYHSLIKPCFADDESPFWPTSGPFVFDVCTMWDIYKTQLPLLTAIAPHRAADLLESLIRVCEEEGNFPIGYRMARGADRFFRQASALAHTALADAHALGLGGLDWSWALVHMDDDLRRIYGEDFFEHGVVHPITHTLDLAYGYHCTAQVARALGDQRLADDLDGPQPAVVNAFDPATGLLRDSEFYEGGKWNYSFRLLHDMAARIALAGGDDAFVAHARRVLRLRRRRR